MSERFFRIILGFSLLLALALKMPQAIYAFVALVIFEAITNWRIPILVSKIRFGSEYEQLPADNKRQRIHFEAERGMRLIVAAIIIVSFVYLPDMLWFMPWFVGFALLVAGLTNLCPMVVALRWAGLR